MSTIADLESKIAKSQDILDFFTNKLKNTNLPNYLRKPYEQDIIFQENTINSLKQKLENKKRGVGDLRLERPASPLPYSSNEIMSPKEFTDRFDNSKVYNKEMQPTTPNSWFDNLKSYNPFKGGSKKKKSKKSKKRSKKTRKQRR